MDIALTGGSSFLGLRLAAEFLKRGHRLTLLATDDPATVRARLLRRLKLLGYPVETVAEDGADLDATYVDPEAPHLGLGRIGWEALAERFDVLWHCPAGLDISGAPDFAGGVPAKGARALLPLAARGSRTTAFHQVSTVLAHGAQEPGTVREHCDVLKQGAPRNPYEKAYADADQYVDIVAAQYSVPAVVHRTGILITDLAPHPELPQHSLAQAAAIAGRLFATAEQGYHLTLALPGDPEGSLNLLPVVSAAQAMADIGECAQEPGARLVHVVNGRNTPVSRALNAFEQLFPVRLKLRPPGAAYFPFEVRGLPGGLNGVLPYLRQHHSYETNALRDFGVPVTSPAVTLNYLVRGLRGAGTEAARFPEAPRARATAAPLTLAP
ncbi:SDR family oxidoreductase [Streptomyces sp. NPDC087300]|uniref:SDR family oxidoreductase n=1 Tax=Streptomyces sp. NPDC087300 TaxID=3365780 RepID=UPI003820E3C6